MRGYALSLKLNCKVIEVAVNILDGIISQPTKDAKPSAAFAFAATHLTFTLACIFVANICVA